ncbi:MAG: right-handed parallel beta-helix repeat-containing protein [candidate division WOR-3 bacterium]|nr:MAG: right-handed parallel beta-helix repeat-containing protein [candidate division WOR-3 bacterium]
MRLPTSVIAVLLAAGVALGQYSGTYTIMPSGGDFASHAEAADSLMEYGVVGPCTLLMYTGTYYGRAEFFAPDWDSVEVVFLAAPGENPAVVDPIHPPWDIHGTDNITVDGVATTSAGSDGYIISWSNHTQVRNQVINASRSGAYSHQSPLTVFENCRIRAGSNGLSFFYSDSCRAVGNRIRAGGYGIRSDYSGYRYFVGNNITAGGAEGIYADRDASGSYSYYDTIANNMANGSWYGMRFCRHYHGCVVYNTFYGGTHGLCDGLGNSEEFHNNIFLCDSTYPLYKGSGGAPSSSDHNCFWGSDSYVAYYNGAQTLASWRELGYDPSGMNRKPQVGGPTNLHLRTGSPCIDSGLAIAEFPYDVDGDTIHNGVRDIGADEYTGMGPGMAGTYLIHQDPDSGNYHSFRDAIDELVLLGTAAACTFDVAAGTYEEQVLITEVPGGYPVVFQARGYGDSLKEHVTIVHGSCPVEMAGTRYVTIQGFDIGTAGASYGIRMLYSRSTGNEWCTIRDNNISGLNGIYAYYTSRCSIVGNRVRATRWNAVYCRGDSSHRNTGNVFINNMFASTRYAMDLYYHDSTRLIYNSVYGQSTGFDDVYGYHETMYNNIFSGKGSYGWYKYGGSAFPAVSDHNCIWGGNAPNTIYHSTYGAISLAQWQEFSHLDSNSISVDPLFVSETDLHLRPASPCRDAGLAMAEIPVDVDGDGRDSDPCIGCDEWRSSGSPMSGVYYIHPNPDSGDYVSYLEALAELALRGFGSDVTFSAFSGTYTGDVRLSGLGNDTFQLTLNAVDDETPVIQGTGGDTPAVNLVSAKNVKIEGLTMNGYCGLRMWYTGGDSGCCSCSIIGNNINGTYYGVHIYRGCHNVIAGNRIVASGYNGLYWYGESTSYTFDNEIYNNMVVSSYSSGFGVVLICHDSLRFFYNSMYGCWYDGLHFGYCTGLSVKDNVVYNSIESTGYYCVYDHDNSAREWDYNCLWGPDCSIARKDDSVLDWAGWQAAGRDSHGVNADPYYLSSTDLHLTDSSPCIDIAAPIPGIAIDIDGELRDSTPCIGADEVVGTSIEQSGKPLVVDLFKAAPNPASGPVRIRWQVPTLSRVSLKVYNIMGQCVSTLVDRVVEPGVYVTVWHGRDNHGRRLAPGIYFYTLETGDTKLTRKVVIQR